MPYVYSTLSSNVDYCSYKKTDNNIAVVNKKVTVKGKANVAVPNVVDMMGMPIHTPLVCETLLNDSDIEFLKSNPLFQMHLENGFVLVSGKQLKPEKARAEMAHRDKSAPRTPKDYQGRVRETGKKEVVIGPSEKMERELAQY